MLPRHFISKIQLEPSFFTIHIWMAETFSIGNVHVCLRLFLNRATRGAIVERPMWFGRYNSGTPHRGRSGLNRPRPPATTHQSAAHGVFKAYTGTYWVTCLFIFNKQLQYFLHSHFVELYRVYLSASTVKIVLKFSIWSVPGFIDTANDIS